MVTRKGHYRTSRRGRKFKVRKHNLRRKKQKPWAMGKQTSLGRIIARKEYPTGYVYLVEGKSCRFLHGHTGTSFEDIVRAREEFSEVNK